MESGNGDVILPFGSAEYVGLGFSVFSMLVGVHTGCVFLGASCSRPLRMRCILSAVFIYTRIIYVTPITLFYGGMFGGGCKEIKSTY